MKTKIIIIVIAVAAIALIATAIYFYRKSLKDQKENNNVSKIAILKIKTPDGNEVIIKPVVNNIGKNFYGNGVCVPVGQVASGPNAGSWMDNCGHLLSKKDKGSNTYFDLV